MSTIDVRRGSGPETIAGSSHTPGHAPGHGAARPAHNPAPSPGAADVRDVGPTLLDAIDGFIPRHIGPTDAECAEMLAALGYASMDAFIADAVPAAIRERRDLAVGRPMGEHEAIQRLRAMADKNKVYRSCIGLGYHGTVTPSVILRNVLENPAWYTQYTPYQAEISQGRMEALINFQTMIADLTGLAVANASLLDEGTAAAEALTMAVNIAAARPHRVFVASDCHPQTIDAVKTRMDSMGVAVHVAPTSTFDPESGGGFAGLLLSYPTTDGRVECYEDLAKAAKAAGTVVVAVCDPLALCLLRPPGEWGADIAVGSAQRFGVPMGFGGPHAAFLATHMDHVRRMPGRIVGVSRDAQGRPAYRLTLQTREQHIKRDRATSNICTAQVLLAVMAGFYAVYHGPTGLRRIAERVRAYTQTLRAGLLALGHHIDDHLVFDTLRVRPVGRDAAAVLHAARQRRVNLRDFGDGTVGVTLDETADRALLADLLEAFGSRGGDNLDALLAAARLDIPPVFARTTPYLAHPVFNTHDSETELLRYMHELQSRDLSLVHSMIPLGSCTMKLNATSEMLPVTWPEFAHLHPFAPADQWQGYADLFADLERWLADITGFAAVSLQPNAGSQGEYAGLLVIRAYHLANGHTHRNVCLIPESAHGTNPASAVIAGMKVVGVKNLPNGAVDINDLRAKADEHAANLAALMVTYPSTCGLFEDNIKDICAIIHERGGQVYMDGANLNAQVGLTSPAAIGADVCHMNLHKTFCIPHGGGGPGMGPIAVASHLAPFLPGHAVAKPAGTGPHAVGAVSAAPYGSAAILVIPWMYIAMMGSAGLRKASEVAILSANYMAKRLEAAYDVLFHNDKGLVAHEFVLDCRPFKKSAALEIDDFAKRLMDYGFHAPTMSWPVPGTLMVEPTESEPKPMLDRFCDAMLAIADEARRIESGEWPRDNNPLKHAPHTIAAVAADEWHHPYSRETAAYPAPGLRRNKFWPSVARVDNPYGDRNIMCSCITVDEATA